MLASFPSRMQMTNLLLQLEDGQLELALNLRMLGLHTLQTIDSSSDRRRERLNVTRRLADKAVKLRLGKGEKRRVLWSR